MGRLFLRVGWIGLVLLCTGTRAIAQSAPYCAAGESPTFVLGFADLKSQVGDAMGDPIECEHTNPDNGDALQQTTTGLAFYRMATNTPTFTNGNEHWGLTESGLVTWTGNDIDPPGVVVPAATAPPSPAPVGATTTPTATVAPTSMATPTPIPTVTATATPAAARYTGRPQDLLFPVTDLGAGWSVSMQTQDAANQFSSGGLHTSYGNSSQRTNSYVSSYVEVYNDVPSAVAGWKDLVNSLPAGGQPIPTCDTGLAIPNSDGSVLLACRIKNVDLIVNFATTTVAMRALQDMIDRVNAQAH